MSSSTDQPDTPLESKDVVVLIPDRDSFNDKGLPFFQYAYSYPQNTVLPGPPSDDGIASAITAFKENDDTKYPKDSYSFLAFHGPTDNVLFFSFGLLAFAFQFVFLILMILSVVKKDLRSGDFGEGVDNPGSAYGLGLASGIFPANVSQLVRVTQITSILSFLIFADQTVMDVAKAIELIPPFWLKDLSLNQKRNGNSLRNYNWGLFFSCVLRFVQGMLSVFAVFLLVMTSSTVIDIVLNFTAVNFISALDDTAFLLAKKGKFGPSLRREAYKIEGTSLPPTIQSRNIQLWYTAAIIPASLILLVLICCVAIYQESSSKWITTTFRVQFQESTGLESYSGCYHIDVNDKINKRYIYKSDSNNSNAAKFGFCLAKRRWVFFLDNDSGSSDPCEAEENEIAHSSKTSSFDASTSFREDWFSFHNTPLEMYFVNDKDKTSLRETCGSFVNDGICDPAFNNFFYQYDGGDCCASTCSGPNCGIPRNTIGRLSSTDSANNNRDIRFPLCDDPVMLPLELVVGPVTEKEESEKTWWAEKVSSLPGWDEFWKPRLVLECDGITVLDSGIDGSMSDAIIVANIDPVAENCSITTEHFDSFLTANYTVQKPATSTARWEEKTRNPIPERIGNMTEQTRLDLIDLRGNDFTGTIPSEIGLNANLTTLHLDRNILTGKIPTELAMLKSLRELSASDNSLSGTFPWEMMLLTQVTKLIFDHNMLTGTLPTEIALLTSLTHLSFYNTSFHGTIPSEIKSLTNLKSLNLGHNSFFGTIPSEIKSLTNLETLNLGHNSFSGSVPTEIQSLTHLEELHLELTFLDRPGRNLFDSFFSIDFTPLKSLTHLDLSQNFFTGPFPTSIGLLTNLRHLVIGSNSFEGEFSNELIESLNQMTYLDLNGNNLSGTFSSAIGKLTNLQHLDLDDIGLTSTIPTEIGNLTLLTHLALDGNNLSGPVPSQLGLLDKLLTLDIGENSLTGTIPTEIGLLTRLSGLWIYFNKLNGTIPCQIESLSNLSILNLNFNDLMGEIPRNLRADYLHVANQRDRQLVISSKDCVSM
jgi:Leucine-rich repeat (LRR) protein